MIFSCGNSKAVPVKLNYTEELKKLKEPLELRRDHTSFCYPYYDPGAKSFFGVIRPNDSRRAKTNGEKDGCEKEIKAMAETVSKCNE